MVYKVAKYCQIANLFELYTKYFNDKTDGYFVEVGAYDGYLWSNTWGLAEAGWNGIYVEPIHNLAERCREMHKNNHVITIECAITDSDEKVKLWFNSGAVHQSSTLDESIARVELTNGWGWKYEPDKYIVADGMKLDTLLQLCSVPFDFDLLVIDVEGGEPHVLAGFNPKVWKPKMVIIESAFHFREIEEWFSNTNYTLIQNDGINAIYVLEMK